VQVKSKLHYLDLLWICRTVCRPACYTANRNTWSLCQHVRMHVRNDIELERRRIAGITSHSLSLSLSCRGACSQALSQRAGLDVKLGRFNVLQSAALRSRLTASCVGGFRRRRLRFSSFHAVSRRLSPPAADRRQRERLTNHGREATRERCTLPRHREKRYGD